MRFNGFSRVLTDRRDDQFAHPGREPLWITTPPDKAKFGIVSAGVAGAHVKALRRMQEDLLLLGLQKLDPSEHQRRWPEAPRPHQSNVIAQRRKRAGYPQKKKGVVSRDLVHGKRRDLRECHRRIMPFGG